MNPLHTAGLIITTAYRNAGLLQEGSTLSSQQMVEGLFALNNIINVEQTQGLKLWLLVDTPVPLVAGQNKYTFAPGGDVNMVKPLRVLQAYNLDLSGIRRPLVPLSWDDWMRLSQVNQVGQINSYFVDKQATHLDVYFWLTPDVEAATGVAHLLLQTQVTYITNLSEETAFPVEWGMFLIWALADELSTGQPQEVIQRCMTKAEFYRTVLENWDVEDASTQFTPDQRSQYGYCSFT